MVFSFIISTCSQMVYCYKLTLATLEPAIIIHGGACTIDEKHANKKKQGVLEAVKIGYNILMKTGNVLDAVEKAINRMEDLYVFDAGHGSVQTNTGEIEMDACIVNGTDLSTGAVGAVRHVANPVSFARKIKDKTPHVFLVGRQAEIYAASIGVPLVPTASLINPEDLKPRSVEFYNSECPLGTVGAVAINSKGQIAAGTSTGGLAGKMNGRVGDSPIIGAGTLADDDCCGISSTGVGESFIRFRVASKIASLIEKGNKVSDSIITVLNQMDDRIPGSEGGVIAISKNGEIGYQWNSKQMAWAWAKNREIHYGVNRGENHRECWSSPNKSCLKFKNANKSQNVTITKL